MIDYGASNIRSALKAFEYLGADVLLTGDPADVLQADKLVLPGVGAFGSGMEAVRKLGLESAVKERVAAGVPLLGICVGMQFLFESSDEMGNHTGLGLIPGDVTRFEPVDPTNKVPHMGWNQVKHDENHWLMAGVPAGSYVYFVHSYYCRPTNPANTIASTDYEDDFCAVVSHENVYGIQFHPEKSQKHGLRILQNYIDL
ncbi:MAG: imidazole glycerol phosphate synthase subunit HisH [Anaerolineae bacterium]